VARESRGQSSANGVKPIVRIPHQLLQTRKRRALLQRLADGERIWRHGGRSRRLGIHRGSLATYPSPLQRATNPELAGSAARAIRLRHRCDNLSLRSMAKFRWHLFSSSLRSDITFDTRKIIRQATDASAVPRIRGVRNREILLQAKVLTHQLLKLHANALLWR